MRSALAVLAGASLACRAVVVRAGTRPISANTRQKTLLLREIVDEGGDLLADHQWMPVGRRIAAADPRPGDTIAFTATVRAYTKGRDLQPDGRITGGSTDYKLMCPRNVRTIAAAPERSA